MRNHIVTVMFPVAARMYTARNMHCLVAARPPKDLASYAGTLEVSVSIHSQTRACRAQHLDALLAVLLVSRVRACVTLRPSSRVPPRAGGCATAAAASGRVRNCDADHLCR